MTERLLQFIWQFRYFDRQQLFTTAGEPLRIIFPGNHNINQGPDFLDASVRIGTTTWAGSVEMHCRSSDWLRHAHGADPNYSNVVLHVVWENDMPVVDYQQLIPVPLLELKGRVAVSLLQRYERWMKETVFIPCEKNIGTVPRLVWQSWKDRMLAERLSLRMEAVCQLLRENRGHWEETCWWLLARNFGMKVNGDAFESLARSLPLTLLGRHRHQLLQLEALLLGQAGLLNHAFTEDYPLSLRKEYIFLQQKYGLQQVSIPFHFLRMRPVNFPTVRLAQLAMMLHRTTGFFSTALEAHSLNDLKKRFDLAAGPYWHQHYRLEEPSISREKRTGNMLIDNVIINTLVPLLFTYGHINGNEACKDKAVHWLDTMTAEQNTVTKGFTRLQVKPLSSFDSQALLQLKKEYCDKRRCLDCAVGHSLLKYSGYQK